MFLEQEAGVDVEGAVAVLVLDKFIFAEFADWQAVFKGYNKVLVHDEAKTGAYCDVRAV